MSEITVLDKRSCQLGEGVLWHPERRQLFWFDILAKKLMSQSSGGEALEWEFHDFVSAAGWIDDRSLFIASESSLSVFDLVSGQQQDVCKLEWDNPVTRSNDGRADPWGGFWIGTMGKKAEPGAGAIYRYYLGELRRLYPGISIPNSICFSPDRRYAYFSDTAQSLIWRQVLTDRDGWPVGKPEVFIDLREHPEAHPDGAVIDASGRMWNAQWGASRVACYDPDGRFQMSVQFPTAQISCPAFGGEAFSTLFASSAKEGLNPQSDSRSKAGMTFKTSVAAHGQAENRVVL